MWEVETTDDEEEKIDPDGDIPKQGNLPVRIALLYVQIEANGYLKLKTTCGRRGSTKRKASETKGSSSFSPISSDAVPDIKHQEYPTFGDDVIRAQAKPEMKAFSYEEEEETRHNMVTPRRNLNSAKKPKKVASMSNVVNDLMRHKILDELENSGNEGKSPSGTHGLVASDGNSTPTRPLVNIDSKKKGI